MASTQPPPPLNIPLSHHTVNVSIIDTTSHMSGFPTNTFMHPQIGSFTKMSVGSYSFLIRHPTNTSKHATLLFDLGVRKDWRENCPTTFVQGIERSGYIITVEKDVATILTENGVSLTDIGGIIWSHWHFDHVGDPGRFPPTTDLIVGPGFKRHFVPAFPTVPESHVDERAWAGRQLCEVDFDDANEEFGKRLQIGKFQALDFYGDGSFYLLNTPGHTVGHISVLARTTVEPPTFIFLGGDIAHHGGEFRPTNYNPLPQEIAPHPLRHRLPMVPPSCPGEMFVAMHPKKSRNEPFFDPTPAEGGWHFCAAEATRSIDKMTEFDAWQNIFPVIAHDESLRGVVKFFPAGANEWKVKGWKEKSFWGFLAEFAREVV
ncbi:Metallo-hydrolase-oxidoreductase [Pyrenophora tritici-repentis]|nr:Metallo-hydrolase-oxidoreductase [Pyrenophora tritici-repentis]